jgi:hypothetical protein
MSTQKKPPSASKTDRVQCRVKDCKNPWVASQNYERHLINHHPEENCKDKRQYGERKFSFKLQKAGEVEDEPKKVEEEESGVKNKEKDKDEDDEDEPMDHNENDTRGTKRKSSEDEELSGIEAKLDEIISKMNLAPPKRKDTVLKSINTKLDFVISNMDVIKAVDALEGVVKEMKQICLTDDVTDTKDASNEDIKTLLRGCKNVKEIKYVAPEFHYNDDDQKVECGLCKSVFKYDASGEGGRKISGQLAFLDISTLMYLFWGREKCVMCSAVTRFNITCEM